MVTTVQTHVAERPAPAPPAEFADATVRRSAARRPLKWQHLGLVGAVVLMLLLSLETYQTLQKNYSETRLEAQRVLSGRLSQLVDDWTPLLQQAQGELHRLAQIHASSRARFGAEAEQTIGRLAALGAVAVSVQDASGRIERHPRAGRLDGVSLPLEHQGGEATAVLSDTPQELLLAARPEPGSALPVLRLHLSKPLLRQRLARHAWPIVLDFALFDASGRPLLDSPLAAQSSARLVPEDWKPQGSQGLMPGPPGEDPAMIRHWMQLGGLPLFVMATATPANLMLSLDAQSRRDHALLARIGFLVMMCAVIAVSLLYLLRNHGREIATARLLRRRLFDAAYLPMVILDADSMCCVDMNAAALGALQLASRELGVGARLERFMPVEQPQSRRSDQLVRYHAQRALTSGNAHFEAQLLRDGGGLWWAEVQIYRYRSGQAVHLQVSFFDITERKRVEEALRESQHRLTQAQEIAQLGHWSRTYEPRAVFVSDLVYQILEVQELTGDVARIEAIRQRFPAYWNDVAGELRATTPDDDSIDCVHELVFPDGRVKFVRNRGRVEFHQGKPLRVLGTLQDVTRLHTAEDDLKRMNQDLEREVQKRTMELTAINRDMESFSYTVSHDLRAPLRSIRGLAQALSEQASLPGSNGCGDCRGLVERIQSNATRMSGIIEGLMALAQMSHHPLHMETCDLSAMAWETVESLSSSIEEREINWRVESGLQVQADRNLLQVLLQNLLSNACKFTGQRAIAEISVHAVPSAPGICAFAVEDNGIGFRPESADAMFRPFARLDDSHRFEGNGIGLATVHRIVQRMHGSVRAEGELGKGARFVVELPASEQADGATSADMAARQALPITYTSRTTPNRAA